MNLLVEVALMAVFVVGLAGGIVHLLCRCGARVSVAPSRCSGFTA